MKLQLGQNLINLSILLKNILIKYYPASSSNELNSVLFDIFTCEQDLASHNYIEDYLFIPVIQKLEYNIERKK